MSDDKEHTTTDLALAAFLEVAGFKIARMVREQHGRQRVVFVFEIGDEDQADFRASLDGWTLGSALVPARDYAYAIRALKNDVFRLS